MTWSNSPRNDVSGTTSDISADAPTKGGMTPSPSMTQEELIETVLSYRTDAEPLR